MPPIIPRSRPDLSPEPWEPQFPAAAVGDKTLYRDPASDSGARWEAAPAGSHLWGWKLQTGGFVRKFYAGSAGAAAGTSAVLSVAFRDKAGGRGTHYEYYFTSPVIAENYLGKLRGATHPGHIVQELIAQSVAYKRIR